MTAVLRRLRTAFVGGVLLVAIYLAGLGSAAVHGIVRFMSRPRRKAGA